MLSSASRFTACVLALTSALFFATQASSQTTSRRPPAIGRIAVVGDERLSALRSEPGLAARLIQRLSRGRRVAIVGARRSSDGVLFYRVAPTRRTRGWVQSEALFSRTRPGDDERLLRLIQASEDFDLIARARIFLDTFPASALRPVALKLLAEKAEAAASSLSRDASRRLNDREMKASSAAEFTFYMNFNELDRYNRQGVVFAFDRNTRSFRYDGAAWREIVTLHPQSPEASSARARLAALETGQPGSKPR